MRKWLILVSLWTLGASGATVWTWVDENGVTHYSDTPVPGARRIDLPEPRPAAPAPAPQAIPRAGAATAPQVQPERGHSYRLFLVTSPTEQQTLWNIGGTLEVELRLEPQLEAGHVIDILIDGERRYLNTTSLQVTVPEVFRGVHTLQAAILDARGEIVLRSLPVTFMVQQTSILNPNNPNAPPRRVPNAG